MKKILFALLTAFSITIVVAQNPIVVEVDAHTMSKDLLVSFLVEIPQTTLKDVEKDWLKYVSKGSNGKTDIMDGVHHQSGAFNGNMSAYSFNVHSKLLETSGGVRLTAWFTQDNAEFISNEPNSDRFLAAQKYVRDFAVMEYREVVENELKTEQGKLSEMEKQLTGLNNDEEKSVQKINENERSTVRANDAIATNNSDIRSSTNKIYDQKEMVENTASDANATKGAKKTLKELEKEKKNTQKQNETQGKNNDSRDKENRAEVRNIADTQQSQTLKTTDIERQRQKVYEVQTKLNNIK